ncbi:MAG: phage major capsid protein [Nitrospira sp.]|nr:phage major capsid protein [Nitrospira sp.]
MSEAILGQIKNGVQSMQANEKIQDGRLDTLETYLRERKMLAIGGGSSSAESDGFKWGKAFEVALYGRNGQLSQNKGLMDSHEFKVMSQSTQKALDTGTGGAGGGFVIPQQYVSNLIERLYPSSAVIESGATVMKNLTGSPVVMPKQTAGGTVSWIGQNSTISLSDPAFGQVQLTPKTMAIRMQISNLANMLSSPHFEEILRRDLARTIALELDRVALRGSGASNQPLGLNGVAGISTYAIGTNGGPLDADTLYEVDNKLFAANSHFGKLGFISHPSAYRKLKKQRVPNFSGDTGGSYLFLPILSDEKLSQALGYSVKSTTQLPVNLTKGTSTDCTELYFGNWEELLIGIWGDLEILATNIGGNAWTQNAIEIRVILNVDIQVRHPESFCLVNDVRTA